MSLPPDTVLFYLYAEPNPFGLFEITAVAQDGTQSGPILVDGFGGATYFGFYATGTSTLAVEQSGGRLVAMANSPTAKSTTDDTVIEASVEVPVA